MNEKCNTGLIDKNGISIREGDVVKGFGRHFLIKFGVERIDRVSPMNGEMVTVDVPCFFFEWEAPDGEVLHVFPIFNNEKGKSDLEGLEVYNPSADRIRKKL